jgi:hypothetical protein
MEPGTKRTIQPNGAEIEGLASVVTKSEEVMRSLPHDACLRFKSRAADSSAGRMWRMNWPFPIVMAVA